MNKQVLIGLSTLSLVTILSAIALSSSNSSAASASTATAAVVIPAACTFSGGGTYTATIPNGTSAEIAGSTLTVTCNDAGGFAIYAIGNSGDEYGNNNMIGNSTNIATGTSGTDSYWAMKITPTIGNTPTIENSFNSFHTVPSTQTKVASYLSSTGSGSLSVNATYKANISNTQLAGTYIGKVKYTMVHPSNEAPPQPQPATAGCINYFANASTAVGEMGCQSVSNNASVTLWAGNFKRYGYGFAGWNDKFDYSGNYYGPNQTITAPSDVQTNGLSLYAVWIKSAGSLQNWNGCSSLASGATTALTDERDGNVYAVAKLADNKCWTIENFRLDDSAELSSSNTDNPSLPITNVYDATNPTTSNHLSATTDPTTTAWCTSNSSACDDQSMLATNNTTLFTNNTSSSYSASSNVYSYGNYYNWYSATAGHGKYSKSSGNVAGDICPAGWHLPTGKDATGDFGVLDVAMGGTGAYQYDDAGTAQSAKWRSYPNNFVYSGYVSGSSVNDRRSSGYYWSSSAYNSYRAYYLYFNSGNVRPDADRSGNKYVGWMVRCVAGV